MPSVEQVINFRLRLNHTKKLNVILYQENYDVDDIIFQQFIFHFQLLVFTVGRNYRFISNQTMIFDELY